MAGDGLPVLGFAVRVQTETRYRWWVVATPIGVGVAQQQAPVCSAQRVIGVGRICNKRLFALRSG